MSEHRATIRWTHTEGDFARGQYSRRHEWLFDAGIVVPASPATTTVPEPYSDPRCVDPEEAFVAAVASCHMLTFLYLAARAGFVVAAYADDATGVMTDNSQGVPWVSEVRLAPRVTYDAPRNPSMDEERTLHAEAHTRCFIAQSVRSLILVHGRDPHGAS
jgi:organic hydroperoxide reductase OsmC/OhrA